MSAPALVGPTQAEVDTLREVLDLMENFPSNDQRARYLLTSNWMHDRNRRAVEQQTNLELIAMLSRRLRVSVETPTSNGVSNHEHERN